MFARMPITNFNYHLRRFAFLSFPVLFLFYLRKRGNEITSIFLLISKEMMILFEKKSQCERVYFLKSGGKINYRRFVNLLFHVEARHREKFPSQKKIRDREITRYSNYSNISFKFPLLPPLRIFTIFTPIKIRRLLSPFSRNQIFNATLLERCHVRRAKRDVSLIPCEI